MPLIATTRICGAQVRDADGEALGSITDVMVESDGGAIAYAVLAHGGVLGVGEKLFAVPWAALAFNADTGAFSVAASAEALERAHGIDKDAWPSAPPADWLA